MKYRPLNPEERIIVEKSLDKYAFEEKYTAHQLELALLFLTQGAELSLEKALREARKNVADLRSSLKETEAIKKTLNEQLEKGVPIKEDKE